MDLGQILFEMGGEWSWFRMVSNGSCYISNVKILESATRV
jgi:hypothetical protein